MIKKNYKSNEVQPLSINYIGMIGCDNIIYLVHSAAELFLIKYNLIFS